MTAEGEAAAKREGERNKSLALMLVMLVKQTLPAVIGGETREADVCLRIMASLMIWSQPATYQAVARAIVAKGRAAVSSCTGCVKCQWANPQCLMLSKSGAALSASKC